MSENYEEEPLADVLQPIVSVLKRFGGHYVFSDDDGEEFVITRLTDAMFDEDGDEENQLDLLSQVENEDDDEDEDVERINRQIALAHYGDDEPELSDLDDDDSDEDMPAPRRVKFEPLKGDLPPELQD